MGVYIKDMNMPENCSECRFGILSGDRDWCAVSLKYRNHETAGHVPDDCPLVEVKTPHGDLIDRNELEPDSEWSERYDGFMAVSESQIRHETVVIEAEEG